MKATKTETMNFKPEYPKNIQNNLIEFDGVSKKGLYQYISLRHNKNPVLIHVPKLRVPFGISNFRGKFGLDFSLDNIPINKENTEFYNWIIDFEKFVIDKYLTENNYDSSEFITKSCISEKKPFSPLLKTKIIKKTNKSQNENFKMKIYDENRQEIKISGEDSTLLNLVNKNQDARSTVECIGIWLLFDSDGKCKSGGLSWKINQLKLYKKFKGYNSQAFNSTEPTNTDTINTSNTANTKEETDFEFCDI